MSLRRQLNWMDLHTHTSQLCTRACSLYCRLFRRGNALSVPGHLVQTPTADLLLRPATVINHSGATLLNTYSAAPPTYFCTLRKIPSLYVLWRDSSPFSLIRAQSVVFAACSLSVKDPHRISNKPFSIFTFKRPRLCKIPFICVF